LCVWKTLVFIDGCFQHPAKTLARFRRVVENIRQDYFGSSRNARSCPLLFTDADDLSFALMLLAK